MSDVHNDEEMFNEVKEELLGDAVRDEGVSVPETPGPSEEATKEPPPLTKQEALQLDTMIVTMVARSIYGAYPTSTIPAGGKTPPSESSQRAQSYLEATVPLMVMLDVHTILEIAGKLSPMGKAIAGVAILVMGVILVPPLKKEKNHPLDTTQQVPTTETDKK